MANEFFTLIVVPHAKARLRKIQVPLKLARWVMAGASTLVLVIGGVLVHYTRITAEVYELRRLRAENQVLALKTKEYEENAGKLQAKVAHLHSIVSKLGVMAGLDHALPDSGVGGEGGVTGFETVAPSHVAGPSLAAMDLSVSALTDKSTRLETFYRDQTLLLSSTPSIWPVLSAALVESMPPTVTAVTSAGAHFLSATTRLSSQSVSEPTVVIPIFLPLMPSSVLIGDS